MPPLDKPTGEVAGDVDMGDFGGGSTDGLVSTAGGLWWFKMGSEGRLSGGGNPARAIPPTSGRQSDRLSST